MIEIAGVSNMKHVKLPTCRHCSLGSDIMFFVFEQYLHARVRSTLYILRSLGFTMHSHSLLRHVCLLFLLGKHATYHNSVSEISSF
jgi:hypothetical protein